MNKKICVYNGFFAAICSVVFIVSLFVNCGYFEHLAYDSVVSYELRQLLAILLLFVLGFVFFSIVRDTLSAQWIVLFSMPVGICLWVFSSFFLLLVGIPYTFFSTMLLIGIILISIFATQYRRLHSKAAAFVPYIRAALPFMLLFAGFAFLTAGGFNYSFVSYDSYFYFINYGHTLTIVKNFQDIVGDNSFTLTNISQFLPLLHSYTAFWGLDQAFQIQACLTYNLIAAFFYGIYQFTAGIFSPDGSPDKNIPAVNQKAAAFSALFTLLLASSTSFIISSAWVLANMYCMVYIFFLFLAAFLVSHLNNASREAMILIGFCFAALTLLRKDGIIFTAFFLICFGSIRLFSKWRLALIFLPSALVEAWWLYYVRVVLSPDVSQGVYSSIANNKNIFFVGCILLGSYAYILIGHDILHWLETHLPLITEYYIIFIGMAVLLYYSYTVKEDIIIDNFDFVIRNMFRYPSSWGISALFFGVLLVFSLVPAFRLDYLHFVWSGYAFLNLVSYCIVDNKSFWLNWDDSYNRVLLQIVPVFVFIMAVKVTKLLQKSKVNGNIR